MHLGSRRSSPAAGFRERGQDGPLGRALRRNTWKRSCTKSKSSCPGLARSRSWHPMDKRPRTLPMRSLQAKSTGMTTSSQRTGILLQKIRMKDTPAVPLPRRTGTRAPRAISAARNRLSARSGGGRGLHAHRISLPGEGRRESETARTEPPGRPGGSFSRKKAEKGSLRRKRIHFITLWRVLL